MIKNTAPEWFTRECGPGGLELRSIPLDISGVEARAAGDAAAPMIAGYGSVSNQSTVIGSYEEWTESVEPGAWAKSIADGDIRSMFNHDTNWLLGRTKSGTLRLSEDGTGLAYETDINPDDPNAMSVHARVARKDVDGSSVWFQVVRQEWTYPADTNDLTIPDRRILEAILIETGPVTFPAFEQTTAQARALSPLDAALEASGVGPVKRARFAADLICDPTAVELRSLFARVPELRDAACSCSTRSGPAAVPAPLDGAAVTAPESARPLWLARARLELARR